MRPAGSRLFAQRSQTVRPLWPRCPGSRMRDAYSVIVRYALFPSFSSPFSRFALCEGNRRCRPRSLFQLPLPESGVTGRNNGRHRSDRTGRLEESCLRSHPAASHLRKPRLGRSRSVSAIGRTARASTRSIISSLKWFCFQCQHELAAGACEGWIRHLAGVRACAPSPIA